MWRLSLLFRIPVVMSQEDKFEVPEEPQATVVGETEGLPSRVSAYSYGFFDSGKCCLGLGFRCHETLWSSVDFECTKLEDSKLDLLSYTVICSLCSWYCHQWTSEEGITGETCFHEGYCHWEGIQIRRDPLQAWWSCQDCLYCCHWR